MDDISFTPLHEPIIVARKPIEGTNADNFMTYGTGGLNIDGCRVEGKLEGDPNRFLKADGGSFNKRTIATLVRTEGRFPANFIHDGSNEVLELFPLVKGGTWNRTEGGKPFAESIGVTIKPVGFTQLRTDNSIGSAARFFYQVTTKGDDMGTKIKLKKSKSKVTLYNGDCRDVLKKLPDNSIDSIVTDPPYELGFMGKSWDSTGIAYSSEVWEECFRVLKPGGHLLSFSGSRTYHRIACAIEDAGFHIRDQIMWVYGSGFPKSTNISIAIDKKLKKMGNRGKQINMAGVPKDLEGNEVEGYGATTPMPSHIPISDEAKKAEGWGTALKPAHEPIVLARKPIEGTNAENFMAYGTGGLNIDECRVEYPDGEVDFSKIQRQQSTGEKGVIDNAFGASALVGTEIKTYKENGRFPANFIHDGSDEVLELFPESKSSSGSFKATDYEEKPTSTPFTRGDFVGRGDSGSAARFFYSPKASKRERNAGLEQQPLQRRAGLEGADKEGELDGLSEKFRTQPTANHHPTVKPTELMRYLIRLVTPKNGTVLDPFAGSGTTLVAATLEGFNSIGIELTKEYIPIIEDRVKWAKVQ